MIFLSRTQSEALWEKREKVVVVVRVGKDWMEEQKKNGRSGCFEKTLI